MKTVTVRTHTDASGNAQVQLNTEYPDADIEVVLVIGGVLIETQGTKPKYDFSEFVGKLEWKGDALKLQKKIRSEWS